MESCDWSFYVKKIWDLIAIDKKNKSSLEPHLREQDSEEGKLCAFLQASLVPAIALANCNIISLPKLCILARVSFHYQIGESP
jgi:hypothetical protein